MNEYILYFVKNGKDRLYGSGNMNYMRELINDYLRHDMYGKDDVVFKVVRNDSKEKERIEKLLSESEE